MRCAERADGAARAAHDEPAARAAAPSGVVAPCASGRPGRPHARTASRHDGAALRLPRWPLPQERRNAEPRAAFTLVEVMIAVALGVVVAGAAMAALRVASGSAAVGRRLADENALIRAGLAAAHDELDWWTMLDDPDRPSAQPLRPLTTPYGRTQGMAFTPLRDVGGAASTGDPDRERDRGWDAADPWAVHDERTWYRGNAAEQDISDGRFGRYGLIANSDDAPALAAVPNGGAPAGTAPARPAHTWLFSQMRLLFDSLGYYGYCEYMPANSLYVWYQSYDPAASAQSNGAPLTSLGGLPMELVKPGIGRFASNDGYSGYPRGLYLLTFLASYAAPSADLAPAALPFVSRQYYTTGYGLVWAGPGEYRRFVGDTETRRALLPLEPAHWPAVSVAVQRFVRFARFTQVARVRWASPVSGERRELNFTGFATTLRGARQQRRRDAGGWARWDDDGSPTDATLDTH